MQGSPGLTFPQKRKALADEFDRRMDALQDGLLTVTNPDVDQISSGVSEKGVGDAVVRTSNAISDKAASDAVERTSNAIPEKGTGDAVERTPNAEERTSNAVLRAQLAESHLLIAELRRGNIELQQQFNRKGKPAATSFDDNPATDQYASAVRKEYIWTEEDLQVLLLQHYQEGYVQLGMAAEHRRAYVLKTPGVRDFEYIRNPRHPSHPVGAGANIGYDFTWRSLCRTHNRPEWGLDLPLQSELGEYDITPIIEPKKGSFFWGVKKGMDKAKEDFEARRIAQSSEALQTQPSSSNTRSSEDPQNSSMSVKAYGKQAKE